MAYLYLDEFENSENDFKKLANLLPNDPTSKNCFDLLQQRKIEKQKKEQKLFKSFLHSKLYEEKDDKHIILTTPAKSIPKDINPSNPKVFFELKNLENDIKSYRVEFELFQDKVPKTTENFISFCRGYVSSDNKTLSYKGTKFHRVIKDFMMQGGDFENGNGTGGCSIYGKKFDDENFFYPHSQELLLSMANSGPNTNGSQFFITFKETPWLDGKHVVFGRVIKGGEFIKELEKVSCGENNIPNKDIIIVDCGDVIN